MFGMLRSMFNSAEASSADTIPQESSSSSSSSVMSAMDTVRMPTRVGENEHPEFAWNSEDRTIEGLREQLCQLYFQLVRVHGSTRMTRLCELGKKYTALVRNAKRLPVCPEKEHLLRVLAALPTQTRDCIEGKGERDLAYSLLVSMYSEGQVSQEEVCETVLYWTQSGDGKTPPPGSWKDIVGLCEFLTNVPGGSKNHPLIRPLVRILAAQLSRDEVNALADKPKKVSLATKWAPRESSKKSRWLFYRLVRALHPDIGTPSITPTTAPKFSGAARKTRKLLAELNRVIGTTEVKQCGKAWSTIDPSSLPAITLQKQKTALLNEIRRKKHTREDSDGKLLRRSDEEDRILCAKNFREHIEAVTNKDPKARIRAERTSLLDLVRDAQRASTFSDAQLKLLEAQWEDNGKQVRPGLPPMIPMVDVSGSMCGDGAIEYAIGLGLRASEKTHPAFRHRIMTFSNDPAWVRLNGGDTFVKRVEIVSRAPWGMNTDFYKAMKLVLSTLVDHNVPPKDARNLVLAVFSDMQIDEATYRSKSTPMAMHSSIKAMYAEYGYEPPHILYWNLRSTDGFPSVTTEKNVTMLSGFSPVLLNTLENKGIAALQEYTPYRLISEELVKPRFLGWTG